MNADISSPDNRSAFTLPELLIAAGVVTVLMLVMVPLGRRMVEHSQAAGCVNNMRQLYSALMAYRADHNGYFPPGYAIYRKEGADGDAYEATMKEALIGKNYLATNKEFIPAGYLAENPVCPSMRLMRTEEARRRYPDEKKRLKELGSYGLNSYLLHIPLEALPGPHWKFHKWPYPGNHRMVMLTETTSLGAANSFSQPNTALKGYDVGSRMVAPRHHGGFRIHWMFVDGHMEALGPRQLENGDLDWSAHFNEGGTDGRRISPNYIYRPGS